MYFYVTVCSPEATVSWHTLGKEKYKRNKLYGDTTTVVTRAVDIILLTLRPLVKMFKKSASFLSVSLLFSYCQCTIAEKDSHP